MTLYPALVKGRPRKILDVLGRGPERVASQRPLKNTGNKSECGPELKDTPKPPAGNPLRVATDVE